MLVDLSQRALVIWSHSSARALHDVPRNVPDDILERIGMYTNAYIISCTLDGVCQYLTFGFTRLPTWQVR